MEQEKKVDAIFDLFSMRAKIERILNKALINDIKFESKRLP